MMAQSIFLIGPMGAGKSTIGRLLAQEFRLDFYDSDKVIEERCGANIPWIFDMEGEAGFREREESAIDYLTQQKSVVLATGGGAILSELNRQHLSARGQVVYLRTSIDKQLQRTRRDKNRPLLNTENPRAVLETLFEVRDPLYSSIADIVIDTDRHNPGWVIQKIEKHMKGLT